MQLVYPVSVEVEAAEGNEKTFYSCTFPQFPTLTFGFSSEDSAALENFATGMLLAELGRRTMMAETIPLPPAKLEDDVAYSVVLGPYAYLRVILHNALLAAGKGGLGSLPDADDNEFGVSPQDLDVINDFSKNYPLEELLALFNYAKALPVITLVPCE